MGGVIAVPICPILKEPRPDSELADEALLGMGVETLENVGGAYRKIRTQYRYEGYAPTRCLLLGDGWAAAWAKKAKQVVAGKNFAQVLAQPRFQAQTLLTLPLGALVAPVGGEPDCAQPGWTPVELPGGRRGWTRASWLEEQVQSPPDISEEALRARLVSTALRYRGAPYRWGGKTPQGIDCSGLIFMAYFLNGMVVYRDARIQPGFDLVEIGLGDKKPGDAIFFPGHVAMYLGEGRYLHATGRAGSDGVSVNSLDPAAPDYRPDLATSITHVGSYRGFHR